MRKESGFSLLEMLVAILILGILGAFAVVRFSSYIAEDQLQKAAWKVMADLSMTRSMAMKNDCQILVTFPTNNQYTIIIDSTNNSVADAGEYQQVFTLDPPVRFGLPETSPGSAASGADLPAAGSWLGGNWADKGMIVSKDAMGSINPGSLYLSSSKLPKVTYCIAILNAGSTQNLRMLKWDGSSWIAL
ncbi:MAG: type II secretion system protein [Fibrobacter sp.]|jgi:prepilin-type N-terminal cleavage/methylation domain-containing protein|nr:type II secretion system protein [Fibrobacter sp.]